MPNSFKVAIEFDVALPCESLVEKFYSCFIEWGAAFAGGHWDSEGYTLDELIKTNQEYISGCSKDLDDGGYYQIKFSFGEFSEVRGHWNKLDDELSFTLLITEDDFYEETEQGKKELPDRMNLVKELCFKLWELPATACIQTAWDSSETQPRCKDICEKCPPMAETFAIIDENIYLESWRIHGKRIGKNGVLLECDNNWLTKFKPSFEYGTEVAAYLEKAVDAIKKEHHYHWADVSLFNKNCRYAIEEIQGDLHYVRYTKSSTGKISIITFCKGD